MVMRTFFFISILVIPQLLISQNKYQQADDLYEQALDSYRAKEYGFAQEKIGLSISSQPTANAYYLSGLIFEAQDKPLRAVAEYEATIRYNPQFKEAYFQKALIYLRFNDPEQALKDFDYLIKQESSGETRSVYFMIDPTGDQQTAIATLANLKSRLYNYRGQANQKMSNYEDAFIDFSKAIGLEPNPDYYVNRGLLSDHLGNEAEAFKDYQSAIKLQGDHQLAWYNLALIDADTDLPSSLMDQDQFSPTLNLLAARALEKEDYAVALQFYNQILENTEDGLSLINRGRVLTNLEQYESARKDFERARYLDPTRFESFYLVGNTYFYEKKFENAIAYYNQYLAIDPAHAMTWYNASMAYLALDKTDDACLFLAKAKYLGMTEASEIKARFCD
jgi:tetratricopeptide (TPR) repeat protein